MNRMVRAVRPPALLAEAPEAGFGGRREVPLVPAASIAGRALVTVIAIMTFLASLAAGGALLVAGTAADWQRSVAREVTIQILPGKGRDLDADVRRALDIARAAPGIAAAEDFGAEQSRKLLEPWLGTGSALDELPIPRLLVVKLDGTVAADFDALRRRLEAEVPGANLDDHGIWLARLSAMSRAVVLVAVVVVALVLTATLLAVGFATRGAMAGNREIVDVLHFVGAEDRFIAREFQRHFRRLGLRGGAIGGAAAAGVFALAGIATAAMATSAGGQEIQALFGAFTLGPLGYAAIVAIGGGVAVATGSLSRAIVFRHLRSLE